MANQRMLNTRLWRDSYIAKLTKDEKLVFLYLLSNPDANLSGIYEIPLKQICIDIDINEEQLLTIFNKLEHDEKVCYYGGWVIIRNAIKHQNTSNSKIRAGIDRELSNLNEALMSHKWVIDVLSELNITKLNITKYNIIKRNDETSEQAEIIFECQYFKVSKNKVLEFKIAFPYIDIMNEFNKMKLWLDANPTKHKSNYGKFILNWLSRSHQPKQKEFKDYDYMGDII